MGAERFQSPIKRIGPLTATSTPHGKGPMGIVITCSLEV